VIRHAGWQCGSRAVPRLEAHQARQIAHGGRPVRWVCCAGVVAEPQHFELGQPHQEPAGQTDLRLLSWGDHVMDLRDGHGTSARSRAAGAVGKEDKGGSLRRT